MKKIHFLSVAAISAAILFLTSCSSGRVYYSQSGPRYRTSISLIISPRPGFIMREYYDGRYYYQSPEGYRYWKGYDNRFYLDHSFLNRIHYDQREYNEWKNYDRRYKRRRH